MLAEYTVLAPQVNNRLIHFRKNQVTAGYVAAFSQGRPVVEPHRITYLSRLGVAEDTGGNVGTAFVGGLVCIRPLERRKRRIQKLG